MTRSAPVPLERPGCSLRQRDDLMRGAGTVPTLPEEISAVVDRYDGLLVAVAVMLDVDVPRDGRSPVDPELPNHTAVSI